MAINVYWTCLENEWQRAEKPVPILKTFFENNNFKESGLAYCPALRDSFTNLYGLKSIYEYELIFKEKDLSSGYLDQSFFDKHVVVRSLSERVLSFIQEFLFLTDEKSLEITGNLMPYMEDNNITKTCIPTPGKFDIAKWHRPVEFGFKQRPECDTFKITEGEIFSYIQFHTNQKINFIQFKPTEKLKELILENMSIRHNKRFPWTMPMYYQQYKLKKLIMKEAKENIL